MTAATPLPPSAARRAREPKIPSRIHTMRFPDPVWDVLAVHADQLGDTRDGGVTGVVVGRLATPYVRELLRADGIEIGDDEPITEAHADAYWEAHRSA